MPEPTILKIADALDGSAVSVVAASHHVIVASGPDHRPNNTYLTVSAARRLAADLLDAATQVDHTAE